MDQTGEDETDRLAAALHLEPREFARLFGTAWTLAPPSSVGHEDDDPLGRAWWIGGDPPQLMLRPDGPGVSVAKPRGSWEGHQVVYRPVDTRHIARAELRTPGTTDLVRRLVQNRRRTFRYCRYCRRPTPPELRVDEACMDCASRWVGVVF